ncbi:MAG: signal peptidase I [Oscillospiraceae bacterium]|nr:signal peptidase I [Oscillospiraceae bacterium]
MASTWEQFLLDFMDEGILKDAMLLEAPAAGPGEDRFFENLLRDIRAMEEDAPEPLGTAPSGDSLIPLPPVKPVKRKKRIVRRISDILFYAAIAAILLIAVISGGKSGSGFHLFGYSGYTVLTNSMQSEIPVDALVITKKTDPDEIRIGDDITYIRSDNELITHRVVDIIDNYNDSGLRGFQTKGIENPRPDPDIVMAGNVVGVVRLTVPELGRIITDIADHIGVILLLLGGLTVAAVAIGVLVTENRKKRTNRQPALSPAIKTV